MSKIFHDNQFPLALASTQERIFPEEFTEVAECDSEELDEIFQLTNHIDQSWWKNKGVKKLVQTEVRSTSVGDVVVLSNGTVWVCRSFGWDIVGNINESNLIRFTSGIFINGQRK
jgi:hypothetical protein